MDFTVIEDSLSQRLAAHRPTVPETLWHYTSSAALLGIVGNNCLWLSDYRFLNDTSEIKYGIDLFKARAKHLNETTVRDGQKEIIARLILELDRSLLWLRAYVFCFSALDDS